MPPPFGGGGYASLFVGVACHVLAFALGIAWAVASVVLVAATDGVPAAEYEGYNRAAFGMLWIALLPVLPLGTWVTYLLARLVVAHRLRALLVAQIPGVATAAALVAWW